MPQKDIDLQRAIQKFQKKCEPAIRKQIIYLFLHWLRKKQVLNQFLYNFFSHGIYRIRLPQYFIIDAFRWNKTLEGYDFWHGLDSQWYSYCNKNQLSV